jgi:hypothetical protein
MDSTAQALTLLAILVVFVANGVVRRNVRPQRPIRALNMLAMWVGNSIEDNRPMHLSFGEASIGERATPLALVSAEFLYYSAREVAIGDSTPIITVSSASTLAIARDMARRAHRNSRVANQYRAYDVRWLPVGDGLGFVAGATTLNSDDRLSSHVLVGSYGTELALLLWSSDRARIETLASSDRLSGQAIAYALANETLIGEEIFAASGYLSGSETLKKRNLVLDLVRWLAIAAIFIWFVSSLITRNF